MFKKNKILNPKTNYCVNKYSEIGKSVINSGKKILEEKELKQLNILFENIEDNWEFIYSVWAQKQLSYDMKCALIKELIRHRAVNIGIILKSEKNEIKRKLKNVFDANKT